MKIFLQFLIHIAWLGLKKLWFIIFIVCVGLPFVVLYVLLIHWWAKPLAKYYNTWKITTYSPRRFP